MQLHCANAPGGFAHHFAGSARAVRLQRCPTSVAAYPSYFIAHWCSRPERSPFTTPKPRIISCKSRSSNKSLLRELQLEAAECWDRAAELRQQSEEAYSECRIRNAKARQLQLLLIEEHKKIQKLQELEVQLKLQAGRLHENASRPPGQITTAAAAIVTATEQKVVGSLEVVSSELAALQAKMLAGLERLGELMEGATKATQRAEKLGEEARAQEEKAMRRISKAFQDQSRDDGNWFE